MSPLDAAIAILLIALAGHVGLLMVLAVRALLPARRHPQRTLALLAGLAALVGELLALRGLLGVRAPPMWVAGALAAAALLGLAARGTWRESAAGQLAFQALVAAPLVLVFSVALALR